MIFSRSQANVDSDNFRMFSTSRAEEASKEFFRFYKTDSEYTDEEFENNKYQVFQLFKTTLKRYYSPRNSNYRVNSYDSAGANSLGYHTLEFLYNCSSKIRLANNEIQNIIIPQYLNNSRYDDKVGSGITVKLKPISLREIKEYHLYINNLFNNQDKHRELTNNFIKYLFLNHIISSTTYEELYEFDQAKPTNDKFLSSFINRKLSSFTEILQTDRDDIVIVNNSIPYLINNFIDPNPNKSTEMSDLWRIVTESFAYHQEIENEKPKVTYSLTSPECYLKRFNDMNILIRPEIVSEVNGIKVFTKIPKFILDKLESPLVIDEYLPIEINDKPFFLKNRRDPIDIDDFNVNTIGDMAFVGNQIFNVLKTNEEDFISYTNPITYEFKRLNYRTPQFTSLLADRFNLFKTNGKTKEVSIENTIRTYIASKPKVQCMYFKKCLTDATEPLSIEFEKLTANQFEQKHGFIPVMYKFKYNDKETIMNGIPEKTGYYLVLATLDTPELFQKYKKYQSIMYDFCKYVTDPELHTFFTDKEKFDLIQKAKIDGYGKYIDNYNLLLEFFGRDKENVLKKYINEDDKRYKTYISNSLDQSLIKVAFGKPIIPSNSESEKILIAKDRIKNVMKDTLLKSRNNFEILKSNAEKKYRILDAINSLKQRIDSETKNLLSIDSQMNTTLNDSKFLKSIKDVKNYLESFTDIRSKWLGIQNEYQKQLHESLVNCNMEIDSYIQNMAKENIHIVKLTFQNGIAIDKNTPIEKIQNLRLSKTILNLESVEFIVDKVIRIKVDGDENNCVYGGPYTVFVSSESMNVGLLNRSALFGKSNDNQFKVHPHTPAISVSGRDYDGFLNSLYGQKHRTCLGESSPYIYNSFKNNNLAMIVINSLIWLSSANSSDMWGRSWPWFPKKYKDNGFAFDLAKNIADEIIQNDEDEFTDDDECYHEFDESGECEICGYQCTHDDDVEEGRCMICGYQLYNEDENDDDEDYELHTINLPQQTYTPYIATQNNNNNNNEG